MFEDAVERTEFAWKFIYDYQPLIAGALALGAAALTAYVLSRQGKNERIFKIKMHEIEMQNKRRAAAVLLSAEINSFAALLNNDRAKELIACAQMLEEYPDGQAPIMPILNHVAQPYLADHRAFVDNMSMMASETVEEISKFYAYAMEAIDNLEMINKMVKSDVIKNAGRAASFRDAADSITNMMSVSSIAVLLLGEEVKDSERELARLKGSGLGSLKSYKK